MNNEEKILAMLERMDSRLDTLEQGQAAMQGDITTMQGDIQELKEGRVSDREHTRQMIEDSANGIRALIELDVYKKINLLVEGHSGLVDKLDRLEDVPERIEDIQNTVSVLKSVFTEHVKG